MASTGVALGATSTLAGSVSVGPATRMTSLESVAENSMFWRLLGSRARIRRTSGQKPMSSMRSASSSTRMLHLGEVDLALAAAGRAGGREWPPAGRRLCAAS